MSDNTCPDEATRRIATEAGVLTNSTHLIHRLMFLGWTLTTAGSTHLAATMRPTPVLDTDGAYTALHSFHQFHPTNIKNLSKSGRPPVFSPYIAGLDRSVLPEGEPAEEITHWFQVTPALAARLDDLGAPLLETDVGFYWGRLNGPPDHQEHDPLAWTVQDLVNAMQGIKTPEEGPEIEV